MPSTPGYEKQGKDVGEDPRTVFLSYEYGGRWVKLFYTAQNEAMYVVSPVLEELPAPDRLVTLEPEHEAHITEFFQQELGLYFTPETYRMPPGMGRGYLITLEPEHGVEVRDIDGSVAEIVVPAADEDGPATAGGG